MSARHTPAGAAAASDVAARRLAALVERGSDLAIVCDRDLRVRYASSAVKRAFGHDVADVLGSSVWRFVHTDDEKKLRPLWDRSSNAASRYGWTEARVRHRDGSWQRIEVRVTNLLDDPAVEGVVLDVRRPGSRRSAQDGDPVAERLHQAILETAQEGVWAIGLDGTTLFANAKMAELLGTTLDRLNSSDIWEFFDDRARETIRRHSELRRLGISGHYEVEIVTGHGERRWLLVAGSPLHDDDGRHIANLGMVADITHRKHLEQELARSALYDSLTSLPNQALLFDRLNALEAKSAQSGTNVSVLFCALDRLADLNHMRGYSVGDQLLAATAARLRETIRATDTLARYGGDEFVVICPATDVKTAQQLASELCAVVDEPFDIGGEHIRASMSVGVAATPSTNHADLVGAAAVACRHAKELGRGRVVLHDAALQTKSEDRIRIRQDLQRALDEHALDVFYQPIVSLHDSTPVGCEALLRWRHPELGPISPAVFIPIAEDAGLMPRLGAWVLAHACHDTMRSYPGDANWHVAVNVSTRQLADEDIVGAVRRALDESGLPATRLMLEVTETAVVTDSGRATSTLRAIRELGVRIAIDDFGTGYSSLSYLRQFPVDVIKIDRSFVAGMTSDGDDLAIVASIVSLAAAVGVQAVAEGVETEEQLDALRRLGCPLAQGFLWSEAVPTTELSRVMASIRRRSRASTPKGLSDEPPAHRETRSFAPDEAVVARILALHQAGASLTTIAAALNADLLTTPQGLRWHRSSVARVIADRQFPGVTPAG